MKRRRLLMGALKLGATWMAAGGGLLAMATRALAATWPGEAFRAKSADDALRGIFGTTEAETSDQVRIDAPLQAENGAIVPVKISTTLPAVESIAIVAPKNPVPLVTTLVPSKYTAGYYSARIKMGETSEVHAYVRSAGKLYMAAQEIKITIGGCGG